MEEDDGTFTNQERIEQLGYKPQKEIIYNKLLPYADELDDESKKWFNQIKINLSKSVILRELHPGCAIWSARLMEYIKLYGLKFSKEDHVAIVKLLYEVLTIPELEPHLVYKFAHTMIMLLKKKHLLSPDDITLDWKPLYNVCQKTVDSKHGLCRYYSSLEHTLLFLVHLARHYFACEATKEILDELKPKLTATFCVPNSMDLLVWFLPLSLPPEKADFGYKLWLADIMELWSTCNNMPAWEPQVMKLIANLASNNVGYIDWEPHIPMMFTRFLRSFNLPVTYKQHSSKLQKTEASSIALWIVSALDGQNSCQKYLDKFLKTIESYFHPANFGVWFFKLKELLRKLTQCFVQRLHYERYKKFTWESPVPESRKLSEEDIDRFVESVKGIAMQCVFSKYGCGEASIALQHLATLRPKIIIPVLIERFYSTLDSVTEPHKWTSVMHCVTMVARPLVQGPRFGYPEGPTHVVPMLMSALPGIDANDLKKCIVTVHFIFVLVNLVPLVDSSKAAEYYSNLTEEEEVTCAATANFEDFVLQFFDRIFNFVESSSLEPIRKDDSKRSKMENLTENLLSSVCHSVLSQSSADIFKTALKKLHAFVTERILETKVAGQVIASLCKIFSRVNAEETLKCLLPHFCNTVLTLTESEEVRKEEILDEELHYNLLILSELVDCRHGVMPYVLPLLTVVDRVLSLSAKDGFMLGSRLLDHILLSLTTIWPTETRTLPRSYDSHVKDYLPVRDWGEPAKLSAMNLRWHVPGPEERRWVEKIVRKYLPAELDALEKHISDARPMSRTELLRSLNVILSVLDAHTMLPVWEEDPLVVVDSALKMEACAITNGVKEVVRMADGGNVKYAVAQTINKLQKKFLECAEDDTKSLFAVIQIWERLISNKVRLQSDFDGNWKNFQMTKKFYENPLVKKKRHLRVMLIERTILQHDSRMENTKRCLTNTHKMIMLNLLELSCSHYSKVRTKAQSSLFKGLIYFSFSYRVLIPQLLQNLQADAVENHERFKGSLYVLSGPKQLPLIARYDWKILELWLALVKSKPSEKLSVIKLLDGLIKIVNKHFPTMTIGLDVPESCLEKARVVFESVSLDNSTANITQAAVEEGKRALVERGLRSERLYLNLLNALLDTIDKSNLHWRYYSMALCFLRDLAHPDVPYPAGIVKTFLNTLINDSIELRKIAIKSTLYLLIQQKRKSKKVGVDVADISRCSVPEKPAPGIRPDNLWLQYDSARLPKTQAEWDEPRYVHKRTFGYFQWPKEFEMYACSAEQPPLDRDPSEMNAEERQVLQFFSDQKNVAKLIEYFSLEEKKGKDKFSGVRFWIFKYLFRNHGDSFLHVFKPHLEALVADGHESSQRCAAEIIGGIIRGCKHWPFDKVEALWRFLGPLIRTGLSNMTDETVADWGTCFASAAENIDPTRNHWLLETLMENPFSEKSSFLGCGRLFALLGALHQQDWRVAELHKRLLKSFEPYLCHPFQNVRECVASALVNIFQADIKFPGSTTLGPHPEEFMTAVVSKLEVLYLFTKNTIGSNNSCKSGAIKDDWPVTDLSNRLKGVQVTDNKAVEQEKNNGVVYDSSDKDVAIRLLKTVCSWITGTLTKIHRNVIPEFYLIFPLLCSLESYDQDEELVKLCSSTLASLAKGSTSAEHIPVALKAIKMVARSGSWWARSSVVAFLQVFVFHNMPLISSRTEWTSESTAIVLDLLEDKRVEVREKAAEVLGGFIHCDFIGNSGDLLKNFKKKAMEKGSGRNPDWIRVRHAGILGLCSFINSSPYDVPDYVPEIFFILGDHLNDPQPVPSTIRKTLGDFKRTHHDDWDQHQLKFTDKQLEVMNDMNVPPSYYA